MSATPPPPFFLDYLFNVCRYDIYQTDSCGKVRIDRRFLYTFIWLGLIKQHLLIRISCRFHRLLNYEIGNSSFIEMLELYVCSQYDAYYADKRLRNFAEQLFVKKEMSDRYGK